MRSRAEGQLPSGKCASERPDGGPLLDVAREIGWFDELVAEVFAPGGLRARLPDLPRPCGEALDRASDGAFAT